MSAPKSVYRERLDELFGRGAYRIKANGDIRPRVMPGVVWGRVGDPLTEKRLFGAWGASPDSAVEPSVGHEAISDPVGPDAVSVPAEEDGVDPRDFEFAVMQIAAALDGAEALIESALEPHDQVLQSASMLVGQAARQARAVGDWHQRAATALLRKTASGPTAPAGDGIIAAAVVAALRSCNDLVWECGAWVRTEVERALESIERGGAPGEARVALDRALARLDDTLNQVDSIAEDFGASVDFGSTGPAAHPEGRRAVGDDETSGRAPT